MRTAPDPPSSRCALWMLVLACLLGASALALPAQAQTVGDTDGDGLPDEWETQFGLDPSRNWGDNGATGDPDADGLTNADEYRLGSHPRGFSRRLFAEGATGSLFDVRLALFNPSATTSARVLFRFLTASGGVVTAFRACPPLTRMSLYPEDLPGLQSVSFSTEVESDVLVVADRLMTWDTSVYGSHAETGAAWPATTWYFAEGATHGGFSLYYTLHNPATADASVEVTYLLPSGDPIRKRHLVPASSRYTILVNDEDASLAATDVSAVFVSDLPIVVERVMYVTRPGGRFFEAGTVSLGLTSPATKWMLAEGATGDFFDLFLCIANPTAEPADVVVTYLLPDGTTIAKPRMVAANSRYTVWVDTDDPLVSNTSVSMTVESKNGVPVLVERAMWWPGSPSTWQEGHSATAVTRGATRWAVAEGEVGGPAGTVTYLPVANVSDGPGTVRVTLFFEDGGQAAREFQVPGHSRLTVSALDHFPASNGRRFASLVESVGTPVDLVVERAMYSSEWAAGSDALGTPLDSGVLAPGVTLPVVTVTSDGAHASELGVRPATLVVSRTSSTAPLTVAYAIAGAASPSDYQALDGRVSFAAGESTAVIVVTPVDDVEAEPDETVLVSLAAGDGYLVGPRASVAVTIADDDARPSDGVTASSADAVRFLEQATFGPTPAAVSELQAKGYARWFDDQVAAPRSSFVGFLDAITGETLGQNHVQEAWFTAATTGADQLRQRVANAFLEILVVSQRGGLNHTALASYMDTLMIDAFANFRTILQDVTLHPAMGRYLNMLQNAKENPRTGRVPNENYARELLQLFSIGLYRLNLDGTPVVGPGGLAVPTYDQTAVVGFSKVWTGWTYWQPVTPYVFYPTADWRNPMVAVASYHSTGTKLLLDGVTLPAGQTAEKDMQDALDLVFNHPNVGPFIGRRLIQRLVTSNPSPAYVARVAAAFNNNGAGVRGDMKAVVRAILFDEEARSPRIASEPRFGHLREPMIRFVHVLRAFRGRASSGRYKVSYLESSMNQAPFRAPTVFNFFLPDYAPAGSIAESGLVAPEFQITTETSAIAAANAVRNLVYYGYGSDPDRIKLDLLVEQQLSLTPGALLDRLDGLLFGGRMSADLRRIVTDAVAAVPSNRPLTRAQVAVTLLANSPEFLVQK